MFPTLLTIGSFELSTYGVLAAAGYAAGIHWLSRRRADMGLEEEQFWSLVYWLFGGALLGGKLAYALVERDVALLWRDLRYGFVFFGGFLGAAAVGWAWCRAKGKDFARLADWFGVAIPVGHAIGRLGCLAAGCCFGRPGHFPQLYESAANAAIALLVARAGLPRVRDGRWRPGSAFALYAASYSAARLLIEFTRADDRGAFVLGLSPSQWVAAAVLLLCAIRSKSAA